MFSEFVNIFGILGSGASIISLIPLLKAERDERKKAGSIVDSAITNPHRQIVRKIVRELSSRCWKYSELNEEYKRAYPRAERVEHSFWRAFDDDATVDFICELCKTYVECGFDFEKIKQNFRLYENAKGRFSPKDDEVFDNSMRQIIPIFAYFLTEDPRIAAQWIARDLRALHEKMDRNESLHKRYHVDIDEESIFAEQIVSGGPLEKMIGQNDAKILALYQIIISVRDKQIRKVILRAYKITDTYVSVDIDFWVVLQNFIIMDISLDTIRKNLFSAVRSLNEEDRSTNCSLIVDYVFRENLTLLFLAIAFLKSDKVAIRPILGSDDSGKFYNYRFNYHCEGYQDLEVLVSFAVRKCIDLHNIKSRYCKLDFVEEGISGNRNNCNDDKEIITNSILKRATVIWNALYAESGLDSEGERKARTLNKRGGEMLNHEYRNCIVIVFGSESLGRCVHQMCRLMPNVVFVQKDESTNASELFDADLADSLELDIDMELNQ